MAANLTEFAPRVAPGRWRRSGNARAVLQRAIVDHLAAGGDWQWRQVRFPL
ncbi:hypothetical protein [Micromonospora antibiotica]|uniref:Transposase n=1 Tax=Micromonospora antibiotica TaxID=2807623 RepID=A0ABS3V894_9ACTN|nr:hypothetical protein [Micromonospora antibiotica]MBO4161833.1 hypothetical protein [Micromonospora antibiotica]